MLLVFHVNLQLSPKSCFDRVAGGSFDLPTSGLWDSVFRMNGSEERFSGTVISRASRANGKYTGWFNLQNLDSENLSGQRGAMNLETERIEKDLVLSGIVNQRIRTIRFWKRNWPNWTIGGSGVKYTNKFASQKNRQVP